ncbi:MAG: diaminopimelate decarboxylase, partial [Acidobacteriota bacterium]|nr:diaminopimelate decarboxylase [Acidobacteriota bacterium]
TLRARAREAAAAFDDGVAFASKSFLCGAMARLVVEEGLCVDVSTGGELDLVLRAGVSPQRVIVHGNNKSDEEVARAVQLGVHRFVVDSFYDVERLRSLASKDRPVNCLVRVTPGVEAHTHEFVRTGQADSKFGLSVANGDARRAIDELRALAGIRVHGVHAHIGSQIFGVEGFAETIKILAAFTRDDDFDELCVGGGLGVAYVEGESAPSITSWARELRAALAASSLPTSTRLLAEPGRAIVAQAAVTLYTVGAVKKVPQRTYLAVDGGMSDNPRPVLYGSGYEAFDVSRPRDPRAQGVRLVGKHCESGDVIIDEAWLPDATTTGDLIATPVTGAYGYSMASNYNRVARPAVVFVRDGVARVVLRRETFDDLARLEP